MKNNELEWMFIRNNIDFEEEEKCRIQLKN